MASKSQKTKKEGPVAGEFAKAQDDDSSALEAIDLDFMGSREDTAAARTVASRERMRRQMEEDMQAFLSKGGAIQHIAPNVLGDPPRKPSTAYGSRPI
jgi:hypothetical protein